VSSKRKGGVLVAGGGTAGHVLPGIAIAEALLDRGVVEGREDIRLVGSRRGIERKLVPQAGFSLVLLPGRGIQRKVTLTNVAALVGLLVATVFAFCLMFRKRPWVVVAMGGYASVPCGVAAVILRIPLVVTEQNAVAGAANRLLGRFASVCAVAVPGTGLPREIVTGNPVRDEIRKFAGGVGREVARSAYGLSGRPLLLVFGGSLGAQKINQAVFEALESWDGQELVVHHVLGSRDWGGEKFKNLELSDRVEHRVVEYERDLPSLLAAADLVLCRSGATSIAELTVIGVPALLVPLPTAPRDHQMANARVLLEAGAARILMDSNLNGEYICKSLTSLLRDSEGRKEMARAAAQLGRPDASDKIADLIRDLANV